jgi:hypothetical protein
MNTKHQSINRFKPTKSTLHSKAITQAEQAKPLTSEELFAQANADKQDTHWDMIVDHAIQLGNGE